MKSKITLEELIRRGVPKNSLRRKGAILILSVGVIVMSLAFAAFTVDVGFLCLAQTQLQSANDAAALGAALELSDGVGLGATKTQVEVEAAGNAAAVAVAAAHRAADRSSAYVNPVRDIRYGQVTIDSVTGENIENWGTSPYNAIEVSIRRDQTADDSGSLGDSRIPLFFAPVIGHSTAKLTTTAVAGMYPGAGIEIQSGSAATADVLPIALDKETWDALMAGTTGSDNYRYNATTGAVTSGEDGVREVGLYPYGNNALPPGNRGTVDLGNPNNSTNDLKRQILYGLNDYDLSFFGGQLRTDLGPLYINGDTGISAGIKSQLEQIKGQPRLIPIFTDVSGPGNNAVYTVVKFVGIRIMYVKLTGGNKTVVVQPAPFTAPYVIKGSGSIQTDTYFTPVSLMR